MNTTKKNQHYVPKFYLRNFSYEGNGNQIGIFNLKSSFFYPTANLKDQGSKNFFYGYDGKIEDSLSDIENFLATLIQNIIRTHDLPKKGSAEHLNLLIFVVLTHSRNPVMVNHVKGVTAHLRSNMLEVEPTIDVEESIPDLSHDQAISLALEGLQQVPFITDLDYKLLINRTDMPFISSDFPIVKYNKFLENKRYPFGKTGYGTLGLQIFVPLSPDLMIVFYDPMVYKVGFKKQSILEINDEKSIENLNMLQVVNCFETLFFNEKATRNYIFKLVLQSSKYKKANQTTSELSYIVSENTNFTKPEQPNLVRLSSTDCEIDLMVNGINIHSGSKRIKFSESVAQLRPHAEGIMSYLDSLEDSPKSNRIDLKYRL